MMFRDRRRSHLAICTVVSDKQLWHNTIFWIWGL